MRPLARRGRFTLTWPVIAFVVVAAIAIEPFVNDWASWPRSFASDPVGFGSWLVSIVVPRLALPLVGAALYLRHPDVHRRMPLLVMGAGLLAVEPLITRAVRWLEAVFRIDSGMDIPVTTPISVVVGLLGGLLGAFGAVYLGRGLAQARQCEDRAPVRRLVGIVVGIVLAWGALAAMLIVTTSPLETTLAGAVASALWVIASVVGVLASGYLAVSATRGALAGELGRRAWVLAAVGAWGMLLLPLVINALTLGWSVPGWPSDLAVAVYQVLALAASAAHVLLLLAFLDGLPDDDDITWFDLAELDGFGPGAKAGAGAGAAGPQPDPFDDDGPASDGPAVFELEDRRLDR